MHRACGDFGGGGHGPIPALLSPVRIVYDAVDIRSGYLPNTSLATVSSSSVDKWMNELGGCVGEYLAKLRCIDVIKVTRKLNTPP
jgi:hypothetical protein